MITVDDIPVDRETARAFRAACRRAAKVPNDRERQIAAALAGFCLGIGIVVAGCAGLGIAP